MKIIVADANLVPHRERFEAAVPADARVCWQVGGVSPDELRDADVYVGSRFTAAMADAAEKLRLIHVAGAGTDKVEFDALAPDTLVANTFHHEQSIAEYIVAAAVMLRRDFLTQDRRAAAQHMGDVGVRLGDTPAQHTWRRAHRLRRLRPYRPARMESVARLRLQRGGGDRFGSGAGLRPGVGGQHR